MQRLGLIYLIAAGLGACGDDGTAGDATSATDTTGEVGDTGATTTATDATAGGDAGDSTTTTTDTTTADTAAADTAAADTANACAGRECGPAPGGGGDCGTCTTPGKLACNDGVCEARCVQPECAAMNHSVDTCESAGPCDGSPDGAITHFTYICSADHTVCEESISAVDCGLFQTECDVCDLAGTGDGRCRSDTCVPAAETTCRPAACGGRECGPAPTTHEDCGTCDASRPACNHGLCGEICDVVACAAMSYTQSTCDTSNECDGSPPGANLTATYDCNGDNVCEATLTAIDCGLAQTDCMPCDLDGTDDGFCSDDVCRAPEETTCE